MNITTTISSTFRRIFHAQLQPDNTSINKKKLDLENPIPKLDDNQPDKSRFNFKLYFGLLTFLVGSVSAMNWLVDPLWYNAGNRLTGKNFAFNERVSKTNLFLRTKHKNYDCLILGSSRVIALNTSNFKGKNCFNYSIKGGEIPDFLGIAQFVKEQGISPKIVYVGVDEFNFVQKERANKDNTDFSKFATPSVFQAYLSSDVLMFSLMTLLGQSPDPANYYNNNFEVEEFATKPIFKPELFKPLPPQKCDMQIVNSYIELRNIFPNAKMIGYIPPRATASVINETYGRKITDCTLEAFHKVAQAYDGMYDFSVPSELTKNPDNTFDGSHFSPKANDQVAAVLQGKASNIAIKVDKYTLAEYQKLYKGKLKEFLQEKGN